MNSIRIIRKRSRQKISIHPRTESRAKIRINCPKPPIHISERRKTS